MVLLLHNMVETGIPVHLFYGVKINLQLLYAVLNWLSTDSTTSTVRIDMVFLVLQHHSGLQNEYRCYVSLHFLTQHFGSRRPSITRPFKLYLNEPFAAPQCSFISSHHHASMQTTQTNSWKRSFYIEEHESAASAESYKTEGENVPWSQRLRVFSLVILMPEREHGLGWMTNIINTPMTWFLCFNELYFIFVKIASFNFT
jgi:hypothetical protein